MSGTTYVLQALAGGSTGPQDAVLTLTDSFPPLVWRKVVLRLADLPRRQRLVVELGLFHDLSFEEIGAIVESTEDAAKVNYHHGVKRLRALLPSVK